jgi:hypothetical protein
LLGQDDLPGDTGSRLPQRGRHAIHHRAVCVRREDEDNLLTGEQAAQQAALGGLGERLIRGDLIPELLVVRVERFVGLQLVP